MAEDNGTREGGSAVIDTVGRPSCDGMPASADGRRSAIAVTDGHIRISGSVDLRAPKAADQLASAADGHYLTEIESLLEYGAEVRRNMLRAIGGISLTNYAVELMFVPWNSRRRLRSASPRSRRT